MKPTLCIEHLTIDLPEGADRPHAIRDVSLSLYAGRTLCIVGESGSGKSITSLQAVYVPADDYTDPAPAAVFAHLA